MLRSEINFIILCIAGIVLFLIAGIAIYLMFKNYKSRAKELNFKLPDLEETEETHKIKGKQNLKFKEIKDEIKTAPDDKNLSQFEDFENIITKKNNKIDLPEIDFEDQNTRSFLDELKED